MSETDHPDESDAAMPTVSPRGRRKPGSTGSSPRADASPSSSSLTSPEVTRGSASSSSRTRLAAKKRSIMRPKSAPRGSAMPCRSSSRNTRSSTKPCVLGGLVSTRYAPNEVVSGSTTSGWKSSRSAAPMREPRRARPSTKPAVSSPSYRAAAPPSRIASRVRASTGCTRGRPPRQALGEKGVAEALVEPDGASSSRNAAASERDTGTPSRAAATASVKISPHSS